MFKTKIKSELVYTTLIVGDPESPENKKKRELEKRILVSIPEKKSKKPDDLFSNKTK
jgi:hypothetical protein